MVFEMTNWPGEPGVQPLPQAGEPDVVAYLLNGQCICRSCVEGEFTGQMEAFWADNPTPLTAAEMLRLGNPPCATCAEERAAAPLVQAHTITLEKREGLPQPQPALSFSGPGAWEEANAQLRAWGTYAHRGNKVRFTVLYADGRRYEGQLELPWFETTRSAPDGAETLGTHMRAFLEHYLQHPYWRPAQCEAAREEVVALCIGYDLGGPAEREETRRLLARVRRLDFAAYPLVRLPTVGAGAGEQAPSACFCRCRQVPHGHPADHDPQRAAELITLPSLLAEAIEGYRQDLEDVRGALCPWHQENYRQVILALERLHRQLEAADDAAHCLRFQPPLRCRMAGGACALHCYFTRDLPAEAAGVEGALVSVATGGVFCGPWWNYPFELVAALDQEEARRQEGALVPAQEP